MQKSIFLALFFVVSKFIRTFAIGFWKVSKLEAFMNPTVIEDNNIDFEPYEEDGFMLIAAESAWLKTITGKNSVDNRLSESIGQTNRVLLHMTADYNPGTLARSIKRYFELNPYAREVLVYKGKKEISVTKKSLEDANFFRTFIRRYAK